MNVQEIKLIIWDLDDTFWKGTISEGEITIIEKNIELLRVATDAGIVNSICSKNDFDVAKNKLIDMGIWDFFVFPSIDWSSKGNRVKWIIDIMKLRAVNVLFIDDNIQNLEEAKHFSPGLMTALPHEIPNILHILSRFELKDVKHKRLKQYQVLEEKEACRSEFQTNYDFLMSCNIRVEIKHNCESVLYRIHDLIMRSNQLNYTKKRQSIEELNLLIQDKDVECGYVSVKDKFGDYGIVGFYAIKKGDVIHYVFSCRTLGMQVEQYVYQILSCPKIKIVGDVVSPLTEDFMPPWVNQKDFFDLQDCKPLQNSSILLKGPCDMSQMHAFLNSCSNLTTEFSYTNDSGVLIEGHNHTSQIVTSLYATAQEKNDILSRCSFLDPHMLDTELKNKNFEFVVISMLTDGNLGIYKHKKSGWEIACLEKYYSLADPSNIEKYINDEIYTSGAKFTKEAICDFIDQFEFVDNSDCSITISNLDKIYKYIGNETKLILLLGSEREYKKSCSLSYINREKFHQLMNRSIENWAKGKNNIILIFYDKYIKNDGDFYDTINHFEKRVYYDLANDLVKIFNESGTSKISLKKKRTLYYATMIHKIRSFRSKMLNVFKNGQP